MSDHNWGKWARKYLDPRAKPRALADTDGIVYSELNEAGDEILDDTPMEPPLGYQHTPSLAEQIREMIRSEALAAQMAAEGHETFEESDDFDIPDDPIDPTTPWENDFDPSLSEMVEAAKQERAKRSPRSQAETNMPSGDQPDTGNSADNSAESGGVS